MNSILFSDLETILRAFIVPILAYIVLVFTIRKSGKRTLSKMNAFDFIVTVALGFCLASISLTKTNALAEGVVVFSTLITLQFLLTFLSVRSATVKEIVSGSAELLVYKGEVLDATMKKQRITLEELQLAVREQGIINIKNVAMAILETNGDISIISN